MPQDTGASNWRYYWDQLLQGGKNPLGASGGNIANSLAAYRSGATNGHAPNLSSGSWGPGVGSEAGSDMQQFNPTNRRVDVNGHIDGDYVQVGDFTEAGHDGRIKDYSLVKWDPEFGLITPQSNMKISTKAGDLTFALGAAGLALPVAAAAMGAGAGATAGSSTAGGFDFSALPAFSTDSGVGTLGTDFVASGGGGSGLGSLGAAASGGGGGSGSMLSAGGYGNAGMIAPGMGNAAAADSMLINAGAPSLAGGGLTGALSGDLAGSGLGANMNTARLIGGLASLGAGASGHGSGGGSGAATDPSSIIEQMARTNRVDQNSPLGTRRWTQGPDGRWTVTDAMDPAELANFQNVQGMNADITGGARARLAALLAAPPHPRADRAINAHGFNIGG